MTTALSSLYRRQLSDLARRKDWAKTVELCQALIHSVHSAEVYVALGQALAYQGDKDAAVAAYSQSLVLHPNQPKVHYALGIIYADQRKWALAICHYEEALQQRPNWFEALFRLARVFHRLGESARALVAYEQVVACKADCAEAYFSMGLLHEHKGVYRQAIRYYRQAVFARPSYVKAHESLGLALVRVEAYEAAETVYQEAIALCPTSASLHSALGNLRLAQEQLHPALLAYRQAISLDATLSAPYKKLGSLYLRHQSSQQAALYFHKALECAPHSVSALSDYAWVLAAQGRWLEVLVCFRQACMGRAEFVAAYCDRVQSLVGDDLLFCLQRACGDFVATLLKTDFGSIDPTSLFLQLAKVYHRLGDLSTACGAPARAEQCYRFALTLTIDPSLKGRLYELLGDCLQTQGRRAAALSIYQAGLLQGCDFPAQKVSHHESLQRRLAQSLHGSPSSSVVAVSGVYRYAQDWLAANQRAPSRDLPEPCIDLNAINAPDPECGGLTCQKCMNTLIAKFSPTQVGNGVFRCNPAEPDVSLAFSAFVATIPQGRAWVVPQQDAWSVCNEIAILSPDDFLLGDLSRCYPWYLPGCQRHDAANHTLLQRSVPLPAVKQISGRVAVLSGLSGHIYYHWLFDVLPRFKILQKGLSAAVGQSLSLQQSFEHIDYFVVNSLSKPFQQETLAALGVPLNKVIESDRMPHIQAQELLVPSFPGHLDWVPPSSMDFLRQVFLRSGPKVTASRMPVDGFRSAEADPSHATPTRLYISRCSAKYRHILNESAIADLLSQYGFVTVALETLSVAQQVALFSQAEVIVGAHGSGLSNLVFCSPGATVVELFSPNYLRTDYWMISQYLQLHHYYLVGESFPFHPLRQLMYPSGLTEDFSVDVNALRSLLKQLNLTV